MKINNVNIERLAQVAQEARREPGKTKRINMVEGEWNLKESPQFSSQIYFEGGKVVLEADQPTFMGGEGNQPGPMLYCLFGMASCYASTFATTAAMESVALRRLKVRAESRVDFSRALGIGDNPPIERVKIILEVESDASPDKLAELERLSQERCPAIFCLKNPINLETEINPGGE